MNAIERFTFAGAALALILIFLFPPFMCIDPESNGRVHGSLGHHSIWAPPSPEFAFRALYPDARELPDPERLTDFKPKVNVVRLTLDVLTITLAQVLVISILRALRGRRMRRS